MKPRKIMTLMILLSGVAALSACDSKREPAATSAKAEAKPADTDAVTLQPGAEALAAIKVETLEGRTVPSLLHAQGEVQANSYQSAQVTTRVPAQVVRRLARLGDKVTLGQPLVTLSSVEVAEAQGEAHIKAREWSRVQELGEAVVGGRRYVEAKVAAEQARSKLVAYGLRAADTATASGTPLGQFSLTAPRAGTVLRDNFVEGEHIERGRELFYLADESDVWVEANVSPQSANGITEGSSARVKVDDKWLDGKVIQKHHLIDERTRTIAVRIAIKASGNRLHAGEFVDCRIETGQIHNALTVPNDALYQGIDSAWAVFVQDGARRYRRVKVTIADDYGDTKRIEGIRSGTRVVTQGAFFLNAELSKGSLGDAD